MSTCLSTFDEYIIEFPYPIVSSPGPTHHFVAYSMEQRLVRAWEVRSCEHDKDNVSHVQPTTRQHFVCMTTTPCWLYTCGKLPDIFVLLAVLSPIVPTIKGFLPFILRQVLVNRETKPNGNHTHKFARHPHKHLTTCIFSVFPLVLLWLTLSLGSVSEVRLMVFSVYFLLWQLLSCVVLADHLAACSQLIPVSS